MALISGDQQGAVPQESSRGSLRRLQSLLAPTKKSEHDKDEEEDQDFEELELDRCTDEEDDEECEERTGKLREGMPEVEPGCQELSRKDKEGRGHRQAKASCVGRCTGCLGHCVQELGTPAGLSVGAIALYLL